MPRVLSVYFDEKLVGKLTQDDSGRLSFLYDAHYLTSGNAFPLSTSLPLSDTVYEDSIVRPFFSNLLPDDFARYRVARLLGVSEKNPFAILEIIGRECAGAISLYPEDQIPSPQKTKDYEFLGEQDLHKILMMLSQRPLLAGEKDVRMSLAGAQDKLAIALIDDKIALTKGTSPTTHIIKPPISDIPDSVFNEYFCMLLFSSTGFFGVTSISSGSDVAFLKFFIAWPMPFPIFLLKDMTEQQTIIIDSIKRTFAKPLASRQSSSMKMRAVLL